MGEEREVIPDAVRDGSQRLSRRTDHALDEIAPVGATTCDVTSSAAQALHSQDGQSEHSYTGGGRQGADVEYRRDSSGSHNSRATGPAAIMGPLLNFVRRTMTPSAGMHSMASIATSLRINTGLRDSMGRSYFGLDQVREL
jgi:hypothetical protein